MNEYGVFLKNRGGFSHLSAKLACVNLILFVLASCTSVSFQQIQVQEINETSVTAEAGSAIQIEAVDTPQTSLNAPVQQDEELLSTPVLIQRAWERGEISNGERLLYLTYAIYEHESLPSEYHSSKGWYGTMTVKEIKEVVGSEKLCDLDEFVQSELRRLLPGQSVTCNE